METIPKLKPITRLDQLEFFYRGKRAKNIEINPNIEFSYKTVTCYDRNNPLAKPRVNPQIKRYDHMEMNQLFSTIISCDYRKYAPIFQNFKKEICYKTVASLYSSMSYSIKKEIDDDFWAEFQYSLFRHTMKNDQCNSIYIGLDWEYISKKIGREPTSFEKVLQRIYRNIYIHLAHDKSKNWVRVWISW